MKLVDQIIQYKYSITIGVFTVWMLFFDGNSALFMYKQYNELKDLKLQEEFLSEEIAQMNIQKKKLFSDDDKLEKYAREQFFFKKDDEDVFVFEKVED